MTASQIPLVLENAWLRVEVLPCVGGKVAQILDFCSGKKLLVPPQKRYATIPLGAFWTDYDISGMDDCFPNVALCPYPARPWVGTPLPDHGEWVYGAWDVEKATKREIHMRRVGTSLLYGARKTILLSGNTLEFKYEVQNAADAPLIYLWAAHPMLVVDESGYVLTLPRETLSFRTFPGGAQGKWPFFESLDLSREWIPPGQTLKLFIENLTEPWCELRVADCVLTFAFDLVTTPKLGIWFNHFGFPEPSRKPLRCIAIEPCTSASDRLDDLTPQNYPKIAAGKAVSWSMTMKVESPQ